MGGGGGRAALKLIVRGEGMGGVDERVHPGSRSQRGQPLGAAEPADAYLAGWQPGRATRPASDLVTRGPRPRRRRSRPAPGAGLGGTPEDQDVHRIRFRS